MSPFGMALCTQICLTGPGQPHLGPSPSLPAPCPCAQYPTSSQPRGGLSLALPPQWTSALHCGYLTPGCSCQKYVVALSPALSLAPSHFAPGWAPRMSSGPGPPLAASGSGSTSAPSFPTFLREQPALTASWQCQKTVKELECICCQNSFSRSRPQILKKELTQSKKYLYLYFQFLSSSAYKTDLGFIPFLS